MSDFTMLQKEKEDVKFIFVEGDKLKVFKFDNTLKQLNKENNFFAERMLISTVKAMKNFNSFLCGDINKGIEVYHFQYQNEDGKKIKLINAGAK